MEQVPNIISTKDLTYLEDMFNWHFVLSKKAKSYSELVSDDTIAKHFDLIYKEHEKICKKIIKIIE